MANGIEDMQEKNREKPDALKNHQFTQWNNFQGREDAEMLEEKSSRWNAKKAARREYSSGWDDD